MGAPLDVPDLVQQCAMSNGIPGQRWLAELPDLVATMIDPVGPGGGPFIPGRHSLLRGGGNRRLGGGLRTETGHAASV
jgi:hypothetical protein